MVGRSERNAGLVRRLWGGGSEQGSWSEDFSCNLEDGGDVEFTKKFSGEKAVICFSKSAIRHQK